MVQPIPLSNREQEVVKLLLEGKSNKQIASSRAISLSTIELLMYVCTVSVATIPLRAHVKIIKETPE